MRCWPILRSWKEFWSLAETEGVADIAELNKILERAVQPQELPQNFDDRVDKVARYVAEHYLAEAWNLWNTRPSWWRSTVRMRQVQEGA